MRSLKDARKDAREFMQNSNWSYTLISFSKRFGYYHCHDRDGHSVYFCEKSGKLEPIHSEYADQFFRNKRIYDKQKRKKTK